MEQSIEYLSIVLIGFGVIGGLLKGFAKIFISWFSILLGIIVGMNFSRPLTQVFFPDAVNNILVIFLVGIVLFSLVYMFCVQLSKLFSFTLLKTNFTGLDHILGGVFGGGQAMVLVGLILYWVLPLLEVDMSSRPVSMFSIYWAEKIISALGTQIDVVNKLL